MADAERFWGRRVTDPLAGKDTPHAIVAASTAYMIVCLLLMVIAAVLCWLAHPEEADPWGSKKRETIARGRRVLEGVAQSRCCRRLGITKKHIHSTCGLLFVTFVLTPGVFYTANFLAAVLLSSIEGWLFSDAFVYVWQDIYSIGPYVDFMPNSLIGAVLDSFTSLLVFVMTQVVLGIIGELHVSRVADSLMPKTTLGFIRVAFVYTPLFLACVVYSQGLAMALLEGWPIHDGVAFMFDALCNIEIGLTNRFPNTAVSLFFCSLSSCVTLLVSGLVISVAGRHPVCKHIVDFANGDIQTVELERNISSAPGQDESASTRSPNDDADPGHEGDQCPHKDGDVESRVLEIDMDSKESLRGDDTRLWKQPATGVGHSPSPAVPGAERTLEGQPAQLLAAQKEILPAESDGRPAPVQQGGLSGRSSMQAIDTSHARRTTSARDWLGELVETPYSSRGSAGKQRPLSARSLGLVEGAATIEELCAQLLAKDRELARKDVELTRLRKALKVAYGQELHLREDFPVALL